MDHLGNISTRQSPQTVPTPGRTDEVRNNAGGYVFQLTAFDRLTRFLVLGVDRPTYYCHTDQAMRDQALANAEVVFNYARTDPDTLINQILAISESGRAPSQDPCLFALAVAASHAPLEYRRRALGVLPRVARTGTHLFTFVKYVRQHRGWGRTLRRAVGAWYAARDVSDILYDGVVYDRGENDVSELAYQTTKYRSRGGWTHADLLRLSHGHRHIRPVREGEQPQGPHAADGYELGEDQRALFDWLCGRESNISEFESLERVYGFEQAKHAALAEVPGLIRRYGLTWEMLPDGAMNSPDVWRALLDVGVPQGALLRQLPRLTRIGLFNPGPGSERSRVMNQLVDAERTVKARIHPIKVLMAIRSYTSGRSKGGASWSPAREVVDALDVMFYNAFGSVPSTGKRTMVAVDASGSMSSNTFTEGHAALHERTGLVPREIAAAMMMATLRSEGGDALVTSFTGHPRQGRHGEMGIREIPLSPRQRLDDVIHTMARQPFGGTDCALPMVWALANKIPLDLFIVYTDNETWAGPVKVHEALRQYRETMGIPAKLVVVGMTVNEFTIADPNDPGCLDVAGFDSAVPRLISDFAIGEL